MTKKESAANGVGSFNMNFEDAIKNATKFLNSPSMDVIEGFGKRCLKESIMITQGDEEITNKSCKRGLFDAIGTVPKKKRGSPGSTDLSILFAYNAAMALVEMKRSSPPSAKAPEKKEEEPKKQTNKKGRRSCDCGNNGDDQDKKKKQKLNETEHPPAPPLSTDMLNYIQNELGGSQSDPVLVIMKEITKTDINSNNCRFSMPESQVRSLFCLLTQKEKNILSKKNTKVKVRLILPCLDQIQLNLTWWEMGNSKSYMLNGYWSKVVTEESLEKNGLKEGVLVQVWGFRSVRGELFMALVNVQE